MCLLFYRKKLSGLFCQPNNILKFEEKDTLPIQKVLLNGIPDKILCLKIIRVVSTDCLSLSHDCEVRPPQGGLSALGNYVTSHLQISSRQVVVALCDCLRQ